MKKLLLCSFLSTDELNIIEEQKINIAEGLSKDLHFSLLNTLDQFIEKMFGGHVGDA